MFINIRRLLKLCCTFAVFSTICNNTVRGSDLSKSDTVKKTHPIQNFPEPANTAVFTTKFVITDHHDITLVRREPEDGALMFFSNDTYTNYESVAKIVSLGQMIKLDNTILKLIKIKRGYYAHRKSRNDVWIIEKMKPQ